MMPWEEQYAVASKDDARPWEDYGGPKVKEPVDFSASEMVGNIPRSAKNLAVSFAQPFIHPVDTAKAVGNLALGVAQKAIPGEQDEEVYANQAGQFIMDRYGSIDNFKTTVMQDPVGVMADASSILMGGGGLIRGAGSMAARAPGTVGRMGAMAQRAGQAAMTAGAAIDPLNAVANTAKAAASLTPDSLPRSMYESSAKWRPSISRKKRNQLTETALAEGIMPTEGGLIKSEAVIDALNQKIDDLIAQADLSGRTVPRSAIFQELKNLRREMGGAKINASNDLKEIDAIAKQFDEHMKSIGKDRLTYAELQDFKKNAHKSVKYDTKRGVASMADNETKAAMARGARKEIEQISPDIKAINKREGGLIELQGEVERASGRIDNRNAIGLDSAAKVAASGVAGMSFGSGPIGIAIGATIAAIGSPKVRARIAIEIAKYQKQGIPEIYIKNNILPAMLREAGVQAGKLDLANDQPTN